MSLIKASYSVVRGVAYAGQIADTSNYNIDGTCVTGDNKILIGKIVALDPEMKVVDGHKVVTDKIDLKAANPNLVGAAIMSHAYSPTGEYESGCAINVMTHGRAWVLCGKELPESARAFNQQVHVDASGVVTVAGDNALGTVYTTTGEWFKTNHPDFDIIKIQLTQAQFQPPASGGANPGA